MSDADKHASGTRVQRQITLPLTRAIEIAYKNIRMRLTRSLVVTSGIVLALAFLVSILAGEVIVDGMRQWIVQQENSQTFQELRARRPALEAQVKPLEADIRDLVRKGGRIPSDQKPFDPRSVWGKTWEDLQRELGRLPADPKQLEVMLTVHPQSLDLMTRWIELDRELVNVRRQLNAPQELAVIMTNAGVAAGGAEAESNRIQTRWLLGLALLVAFVGILNAMLMSVTERFREIGTMKCLGALDGFIVKLFVIESLFQGVVGTLIGLVIGLGLSFIAAAMTYGRFAFINLPVGPLLVAVGISLLVGVGITVAAAVYPAWQAARMQPIEAMRVEA